RTGEDGAEEAVLVEQNIFVEGHVRDPDSTFFAERAVVAPDGHFVDRVDSTVEGTVAIVVAHRVGGGNVGNPSRFEKWDEPCLVLTGDSDGSGDGDSQGT